MSDLMKIFGGWPPEQGPVESKPELDTVKTEEFEVSPMVLGLMLSFLLFVIVFWIWLISRSCLLAQPVKPTKDRKPRQQGGQAAGARKSLGRLLSKKGQSGTSSFSKQKSSSSLTLPQIRSPRLSRRYYMGLDQMEPYKLRFQSERTSSSTKTITQSAVNRIKESTSLSESSSRLSKESNIGNTTSKTGTETETETGSSPLSESSSRLSKESFTGNYTTGMSTSPHGCLVTNRSRTAGLPMTKYRIRWANLGNQKDGEPKTETTTSEKS
ncbi:uncharacterized protein LOC117586419 [Drosophila guanche]|uniref:Uncharacterized protein n=1 Tax=Drosophila guanche TaxID=7266 RepID=A0A3B0JQN3_DROGU|nr:uncharacterized protein LOC117586419 [Drosophila guanche]SPP84474.1 Hypothetical predicted protein [Drosophila guanche]